MSVGVLLSRLASTYYLKLVEKNDNVLHYKRSPTWRSLVIFVVLFALTHVISTQAEFWHLGTLCYVLGVYFCYIGTEKYEECIFDKSKKTVTLMNARFLEKHILGYRKKIVTELEEIVGVSAESHKIPYAGTGHQVVLLFLSGLTLSLTAQCTYGDKSEHDAIAATVKQFLGFTTTPHKDDGQKDEVLKGDGKGQDGVQKKGQDGVQKKGQDGLKKKGQDGGTTRSRHKKTE